MSASVGVLSLHFLNKPKKQVVFLPIYKFLCFGKAFVAILVIYRASSEHRWYLVWYQLIPRFRICRSIAKLLKFNPLNSTSFVVGIFQLLPASIQFSIRSGQISTSFIQIWPDLVQICQDQKVHCPDLEQIWRAKKSQRGRIVFQLLLHDQDGEF